MQKLDELFLFSFILYFSNTVLELERMILFPLLRGVLHVKIYISFKNSCYLNSLERGTCLALV